jgi:hypothetical protein
MDILKIIITDNFIEVACSGPVSSEGLRTLIDQVKLLLKEKKELKNILVDLTGIDGKLTFMEHFAIGEDIAGKLHGYKLAVVTKPIVVNKVAENVATKKGAKMLMTYERKKALAWFEEKKSV